MQDGDRQRRPDLLIFVNGIPVAICEFKSAIREEVTIYDAWEQIFYRYRRDIPKLLRYTFLAIISDGANTKLGSVFTTYENFYSWNKISDAEKSVNGISSLFTMIKGAFARKDYCRLCAILFFIPTTIQKVRR